MNRYSAYPHRIPGGFGYWAMIRLCRDAHPTPVMGEAAEECLKHMVAFMNGREIRGESFEKPKAANDARAKAERLFIGGGKVIEVERLEVAR
jgi:hypothetical protein